MSRSCSVCGKRSYGDYCVAHKPHASLKRTPLKKVGKVTKQWLVTRKDWFKANPRDTYNCYLCGKTLQPIEVTLDHVKSRSSRPDLRFDMSNLMPCCYLCNAAKGSRSLETYKEDK